MKRTALALGSAIGTILLVSAVAAAGGWASVIVTDPPDEPQAGRETSLEFQLLQHGRTPMIDAPASILARNRDTGERIEADAVAARGAVVKGSHRVTLTFPSAGTWDWKVRTAGIEVTTVLRPIRVSEAPTEARQVGGEAVVALAGSAGVPASAAPVTPERPATAETPRPSSPLPTVLAMLGAIGGIVGGGLVVARRRGLIGSDAGTTRTS